jgi:transposase
MVDPRNTSKTCPIHKALIKYGEDRRGIYSKGSEKWHREVVALISLYMRAMPRRASGFQV